MSVVLVLVVVVLSAVAAAGGAFVGVRIGRKLGHRDVAYKWGTIDRAARRAQHASALVENANLAAVAETVARTLEKADETHAEVVRHHQRATEALRVANEVTARMQELEQAIAASFSITLTKRG